MQMTINETRILINKAKVLFKEDIDATKNSHSKIEDAVKEIGDNFRKIVEENQMLFYHKAIDTYKEYSQKTGETNSYKLVKRHNMPEWVNEVISWFIKQGFSDKGEYYSIVPNAEQIIIKKAKEDAEKIILDFIGKMTQKLEDVVSVGKTFTIDTEGLSPEEHRLYFKFSDGGHFTIQNKIVSVWNAYKPFYRYPTTFHDAVLANGEKVFQPSEASIKLAFGGVNIKDMSKSKNDLNVCPASGKPWPQTPEDIRAREYGHNSPEEKAYRAKLWNTKRKHCPECGTYVPFAVGGRDLPDTIRKHKKKT